MAARVNSQTIRREEKISNNNEGSVNLSFVGGGGGGGGGKVESKAEGGKELKMKN